MQSRLCVIASAGVMAFSIALAGPSWSQESSSTDVTVAGAKVEMDPEIAKLLPERYRESGLRIMVDPPYEPFLMVNESGGFTGADVAVANAVAARLGASVTYGRVRWDASIPALQAGNYDVLIGMMADTKEREEVVNIINYTVYGLAMVVKGGNPDKIASGADLCGKRLVILQGWSPPDYFDSLTEACASRGQPPVDMARLPTTADTILAVQSGSADATYVSTPVAIAAADDIEGTGVSLVTPKDAPGGWNPQNKGWATLKGEVELTKALETAMQSLLADGTIKSIYDEYGVSQLLLDQVVVNVALPDLKLD